jgi:hypothetical protein
MTYTYGFSTSLESWEPSWPTPNNNPATIKSSGGRGTRLRDCICISNKWVSHLQTTKPIPIIWVGLLHCKSTFVNENLSLSYIFRCRDRSSSHFLNDCELSPERRPAKRPETLKSSSSSGQCINAPPPVTGNLLRSSGVPCHKRGYHASGTIIVRPSTRSTTNESSVTVTFCARSS